MSSSLPGNQRRTPDNAGSRLLTVHDPEPVGVVNADGPSPFLLICDHAGNSVPDRLEGLGLPQKELDRHIAIDIGALAIAAKLSERLDAALYYQRYSRLVIDSNRQTHTQESIPAVSDGTEIPGNQDLSQSDRKQRINEILTPYHDLVAAALQARHEDGRDTVLISVHSFTPQMRTRSVERPWHISVMWGENDRFGWPVLAELRREDGLTVGVNEPYEVVMEGDYSMPLHGEQRGLDYVEFEMRQDLTASEEDAEVWAERLARVLRGAHERYRGEAQ